MIVRRSAHPGWLSNAYLVYEKAGGSAVFVDSGAPLEPLLREIEKEQLTPTHLLVTHGHHDHVDGNGELQRRFDLTVLHGWQGKAQTGDLRIEGLPTPGHSEDMVAFVVNDEACFTGDTLFRDSVGGGDFEQVRRSVMEVLMQLPGGMRAYPGHADETTLGREWDENPFVRVWRGVEPEGTAQCRVGGQDATIVVWSPDYDGKGKAWVRFEDGRDAIVGGSRVERL